MRSKSSWKGIEWNGIEQEVKRVERKEREHTGKCYRPTRGWAMRVSQQEYRTGNLGRTSGPSQSVMGLLESHAIPGVMLHGLSIVHERDDRLSRVDWRVS
jgi:hypothetical protein